MTGSGSVGYEINDRHIARITLDRPERRNAQDVEMTYELNEKFDRAARDPDVRVIVLDANGPHFSAGHDLRDPNWPTPEQAIGVACGFGADGTEGWVAREEEIYLQMCRRWRDIPKPTIAAVHGRVIGGGLMLMWVCDLIVASRDATFSDPVVAFGVNGVEWFVHAWELGARKAKEHLFTSDSWSAEEAHRLGAVNHVVDREQLLPFTFTLAARIADKPAFALKLAKQAVNASLDAQGQRHAIDEAFALHQLAHAHNERQFNTPIDPSGLPPGIRVEIPAYDEFRRRR